MNNKIVNINEFVIITIYIKKIINDVKRSVYFTMKVHIINDFKTNIFIDMNIITFQEMILNLKARIVKLEKCQRLKVFIDVIARTLSHIKKTIHIKTFITITFDNIMKVSIIYNNDILKDRDFLFEFDCV